MRSYQERSDTAPHMTRFWAIKIETWKFFTLPLCILEPPLTHMEHIEEMGG